MKTYAWLLPVEQSLPPQRTARRNAIQPQGRPETWQVSGPLASFPSSALHQQKSPQWPPGRPWLSRLRQLGAAGAIALSTCMTAGLATAADTGSLNRQLVAVSSKYHVDGTTDESDAIVASGPLWAHFGQEAASQDAHHVADWVVDTGDNVGLPFVIVDKAGAKVFVFTADGKLRGAARALLGLAHGDDSAPGIGERRLENILPEERTTPAGRFVADLGMDMRGEEVLWVDYTAAISLHRVITSNIEEHRAQRLASSTTIDKRITYGCINVPKAFYEGIVSPTFTGTKGIVYIMPEIHSTLKTFPGYWVDSRAHP
jgi:hypothetical protein